MSTTGSQITLTLSIAMIVLFSIAIIGFAIGFGLDTDADIKATDDSDISTIYSGSKSDLNSFKDSSDGTYQSILDTTVEPGSDVVQSAAPFALTPKGLVSVLTRIISLPKRVIFGGDSSPFVIFFTIFFAAIGFIFALLLYKTLRGNP